MALIGRKAILEFRRKLIPPIILPASALNVSQNRFSLEAEDLWAGEQVIYIASVGGIATTYTGYLYVDELGVASIHSTITGALANSASTRRSLAGVQPKISILAMTGHPCQTLELIKAYYFLTDNPQYPVTEEQTLELAPTLLQQYQNAGPKYTSFKVVGDARQWTLNTNSDAIDTSEISEKFFNGVKAVVSASGTIDFLVNIYGSETLIDSCNLLRMSLLTGDGAEALARFYLDRPGTKSFVDAGSDRNPNGSQVYYSTRILLTNSAVTPAADGLVVGSADFVATGPLRLGAEIEPDQIYLCDAGATFGDYNSWRWSTANTSIGNPGTNSSISYGSGSRPQQSAWVDPQGNIYIYGTNQDASPTNGYLLSKFGPSGIPLWTRRYVTTNSDPLYGHLNGTRPPMTIGEDGSIWIAMYEVGVLGDPKHQNYVARINPSDGSVISSFCFSVKDDLVNSQSNQPYIYYIAGDDEGYVYVAMKILYPNEPALGAAFGEFRHRHVICKVNSSGNLIWTRGFRGDYDGFFRSDGDIPVREIKPRNNRIYLFFNSRASTGAGLVVLNKEGQVVQPPTGYNVQSTPDVALGSSFTNLRIMWMDFDSSNNIYLAVYYGANEHESGAFTRGYAAMRINGATYNVDWFRTFRERSTDNSQEFFEYMATSIYVAQGDRVFLQGTHGQFSQTEAGFTLLELDQLTGDLISARKVRGPNTNNGLNNIEGMRLMKYKEPSTDFLHFYYEAAGQVAVLDKQGQFGTWPALDVNTSWVIFTPNLITYPPLPTQRFDVEGGPTIIANINHPEDINWVNYGKQVVTANLEKDLFATLRIPIGQYTTP